MVDAILSANPLLIDTGASGRGWSFYSVFLKCPRLFFYRYRDTQRFEEAGGGARGLGSAVHALMAWHYTARQGIDVPPVEDVLAETVKVYQLDEKQEELLRDLYSHYALTYAAEIMRPIFTEQLFRIGFVPTGTPRIDVVPMDANSPMPAECRPQVGVPVPFTQRVDLGVEDEHGRVWYIDHKTTYRIGKGVFERYALSGQIHAMHWVGRVNEGPRFEGVQIAAIQTWRGRKIQRREPKAAPCLVEDFPRLIIDTADRIATADERYGTVARNWPTTSVETVCKSDYGFCDYADRCRLG